MYWISRSLLSSVGYTNWFMFWYCQYLWWLMATFEEGALRGWCKWKRECLKYVFRIYVRSFAFHMNYLHGFGLYLCLSLGRCLVLGLGSVPMRWQSVPLRNYGVKMTKWYCHSRENKSKRLATCHHQYVNKRITFCNRNSNWSTVECNSLSIHSFAFYVFSLFSIGGFMRLTKF